MEDPLEASTIESEKNRTCKNSKYVMSHFIHANGCLKTPYDSVNCLVKPNVQINKVMPYCESLKNESPVSTLSIDEELKSNVDYFFDKTESQKNVDAVVKTLESTSLSEEDNESSVNCSLKDSSDNLETIRISLAPISYVVYESELQMPDIMKLITKDLSEPYSIYTYRYFIHNWPKLCFLAMDGTKCIGAIVCKLDLHKKLARRGYIAMLATDENYRRRGIGTHLVMKAIRVMVADDCDEVVLETEITNKAALRLYENLGFVRDKRLFRYYLNGVDAFRLKLWLR